MWTGSEDGHRSLQSRKELSPPPNHTHRGTLAGMASSPGISGKFSPAVFHQGQAKITVAIDEGE